MATALDLITGALRKIGQYSPGETLDAVDANDALDMLNGIVDIWSNEHLAVFNNVETVFSLVPGQRVYTIGAGGDVNVPRPLRITNAYTRITTGGNQGVDFACQEVSGDKYTAIGLKGQPGPWPKFLYYNTGFPLAQLYLWPVPSGTAEFHLWTDQVLSRFNLTDAINLPQGYYLALQFSLAVILAPEYGMEAPMTVKEMAGSLRRVLKATNATPQAEASLDVAAMTSGTVNDAGWILSGGF